jgi:uncharacterized protein Yka (UPF0111/DUF47 family)
MPILEKLFPRSPFGPLLAHAKKVQECVALLRPLTDAWLREDWSEVDALQKKISIQFPEEIFSAFSTIKTT